MPVWLHYVPGTVFRTNNEPFKVRSTCGFHCVSGVVVSVWCLTVVISLDAEPYAELHDVHREYDEERAALCFAGREHYPSSGHES